MTDNDKLVLTRRRALAAMTAVGAATLPFGAQAQPAALRKLLPGANVCVLTPEQVEGPYYFDPKLVRADITEGKTGVPLGLKLQIVNAGDCTPIKGARFDVWHADATGIYSGYPGQSDARNVSTKSEHFLRGTQMTDDDGVVAFTTVYPGWYQGRTAHIHGKVFLGGNAVLTTQFYFPDAMSEYIYTEVAPYNSRQHKRDTVNSTDMIVQASDKGHQAFLNIKEEPERYLASLIIGVDRTARSNAQQGPSGGPPPGGPPPGGPGGPPQTARPEGPFVPGIVKSR